MTTKTMSRTKCPPEPTKEDYRDWYRRELARAADLQRELALAKATIEALAYSLAYRARPVDDGDIPF